MNRIIKFRVPHFDPYGVFVYFSYWGTIDYKGEPSLDHGCFVSPSSGMKKGWHEQFTGLTDKNGTDIYEGDIVALDHGGTKWNLSALEVIYLNGSFQFNRKDLPYPCGFVTYAEQCANRGLLDSHAMLGSIITIIGNIYEHPELICT